GPPVLPRRPVGRRTARRTGVTVRPRRRGGGGRVRGRHGRRPRHPRGPGHPDPPGALPTVFELARRANAAADAADDEAAGTAARTAALLAGALGLRLCGDGGTDIDEAAADLVR